MHTKLIALLVVLTALPGLALDRQTAIAVLEQASASCALWEEGPLPALVDAQALEDQLTTVLAEYGDELVITTDLTPPAPEAANHDMNTRTGVRAYNASVARTYQVVPISAQGFLWEVRLTCALLQSDIAVLLEWVEGCDASAARARLKEAAYYAAGLHSSVGSAQGSVWYWRARTKLL